MLYNEAHYNRIFSQNLNYYLSLYDISQVELAKKLSVSTASVSYWCKGQKSPRMDKVDALCNIFNCTRSDLMDEHPITSKSTSDPDADELISDYKKLDNTDKIIIKSTVKTLLSADKYKKDTESSIA